jgi:ligand-binding sensor domain-containing protein
MPDQYGRMWIGTDKGIYVADTKQGHSLPSAQRKDYPIITFHP